VGFLNRNQGKLKNETFTLVGYGVDIGDKKAQIVVTERRSTTSYLQNVGREVVTFQINDRNSKAGGGSCFGDSGGGVFWGPYVLGDASYVNSVAIRPAKRKPPQLAGAFSWSALRPASSRRGRLRSGVHGEHQLPVTLGFHEDATTDEDDCILVPRAVKPFLDRFAEVGPPRGAARSADEPPGLVGR
jgi:hypothetical protein